MFNVNVVLVPWDTFWELLGKEYCIHIFCLASSYEIYISYAWVDIVLLVIWFFFFFTKKNMLNVWYDYRRQKKKHITIMVSYFIATLNTKRHKYLNMKMFFKYVIVSYT